MKKEEISLEDIDYLAGLSGLDFDEEESVAMQREVTNVIKLLNGCADAGEGIARSSVVMSLDDLRDDVRGESLSQDAIFGDKESDKGRFVIPKVVN